jgi:hypothetical protein
LKSKEETQPKSEEIRRRISVPDYDLAQGLTRAIQEFASSHQPISETHRETEMQIIGALHGFLSTTLPDIQILTEVKLDEKRPFRADLLVQGKNDSVVIEVKRRFMGKNYQNALAQVEHYMMLGNIKNGILLYLPEGVNELIVEEQEVKSIGGKLTIMKPSNEA